MRQPALAAIALVLLVSGCGKTEDAVNKQFDVNFRASCVGSATKAGAPADVAKRICDCTMDEINKKYTASEKLTLTPPQAEPLMTQCVNQTVKK